jgi:hypothetical protein
MQQITLTSHPNSSPSRFTIKGTLSRYNDELSIMLSLKGPIAELELNPLSISPHRRHELWKETCVELFLSSHQSFETKYMEMNLASSGDWNWYGFFKTRSPEASDENQLQCPAPQLTYTLAPDKSELAVNALISFPQGVIDLTVGALRTSVCMVLKTQNEVEYFSTAHPSPTGPDFHLRDGHTLII